MSISTADPNAEMQAEIERHKYFLSERAGYDVGWEAAEKDWRENHAPKPESEPEPLPSPELKSQPDQVAEPQIAPSKGVGGFFKRLLNKAK